MGKKKLPEPTWLKSNNDIDDVIDDSPEEQYEEDKYSFTSLLDSLEEGRKRKKSKKAKPSWYKVREDTNNIVTISANNLLDTNDIPIGDLTLNELLADEDIEFRKKKNQITLIKADDNYIVTIDLKTRPGLNSIVANKYDKDSSPELKKQIIYELYHEEKKTQSEIADIVGLTQPQISVILKNMKK